MLLRNLGQDESHLPLSWQDLAIGAPTIIAFATLCGRALSHSISPVETLSDHAMALLVAARQRGVFDLRGNKEAFESSDRFLAVCIEVDDEPRLLFRQKGNPRETMRFIQGFQELCQSGLVMHHLQRDFSLTTAGFDRADQLEAKEFQRWIDFAVEVEH